MRITCDKCKKPCVVLRYSDPKTLDLIIIASCHGEKEIMRVGYLDITSDESLARALDGAENGVAFHRGMKQLSYEVDDVDNTPQIR